MTLFAAFAPPLARPCSQEDPCAVLPISKRMPFESESRVGAPVNTLVLHANGDPHRSLRSVLQEPARGSALGASRLIASTDRMQPSVS